MRLEDLRDGDVSLAPDTVALLPLGATEQHGPHLPLGTDTFLVETVARQAAAHLEPFGAAGDLLKQAAQFVVSRRW